MSRFTDPNYLKTDQYRDSSNLDARAVVHQRFSTNPYGWFHWVFDRLSVLPENARILELGCGPGYLWKECGQPIPASWNITLSDLSPGMVDAAWRNLVVTGRNFKFEQIDAQSILYPDETFDAVIANHMLYHVPDKSAALAEIWRVLKPAGRFYASTGGKRHLGEIADLLSKFDPELSFWGNRTDSFLLENGEGQLLEWFTGIKLARYEDALEVTDVTALVDYILSGRVDIPAERLPRFREFVAHEVEAQGGVFHITKDSGLFASVRKEKVE